ncbi:unnamed protein product [Lathyrus oleraceus]
MPTTSLTFRQRNSPVIPFAFRKGTHRLFDSPFAEGLTHEKGTTPPSETVLSQGNRLYGEGHTLERIVVLNTSCFKEKSSSLRDCVVLYLVKLWTRTPLPNSWVAHTKSKNRLFHSPFAKGLTGYSIRLSQRDSPMRRE